MNPTTPSQFTENEFVKTCEPWVKSDSERIRGFPEEDEVVLVDEGEPSAEGLVDDVPFLTPKTSVLCTQELDQDGDVFSFLLVPPQYIHVHTRVKRITYL